MHGDISVNSSLVSETQGEHLLQPIKPAIRSPQNLLSGAAVKGSSKLRFTDRL
jgi:hypothetical protein